MLRPSSLPALKQCPCFAASGSDFADEGTDRHHAFKAALLGDDSLLNLLPGDDRDGVLWAVDYVKLKANLADHPLHLEQGLTLVLSNLEEMPGTPDAVCHLDIFDLKWRKRDYTSQMAAYAAMRLQELGFPGTITVHILFGAFQRAEVKAFDTAAAQREIDPIIARYHDPAKQPVPCDYCDWCANALTCPALNNRALAVVAGREDWQLDQWHASEITDPPQMARALRAVPHLRKWCDAVEHFADEMWQKRGLEIPGCQLKESRGKQYATDLEGIYHAAGVPLPQFLKCCTVRMKTSKDEPDKCGIVDLFILENKGSYNSRAAAERALKKKIEPFVARGKSRFHVRPVTTTSSETETIETE